MNATLDAREALRYVPGWAHEDVVLEEQAGGRTNRVYRVDRQGESYVLRLDAPHTRAFNLDRGAEAAILAQASAAGLAPEVVFSDPARGILLCRYLAGRVWTAADLESAGNIEALAELLRRVHALPVSGRRFAPVQIAEGYLANLRSRPDLHALGARYTGIVAGAGAVERLRCCHNDVVAANLVEAKGLMLLDWEYACDNDPLFDLASVIGYHDLDETRARSLLAAYAGDDDRERYAALCAQVRLYDALHWLWLANREMTSPDGEQRCTLARLAARLS